MKVVCGLASILLLLGCSGVIQSLAQEGAEPGRSSRGEIVLVDYGNAAISVRIEDEEGRLAEEVVVFDVSEAEAILLEGERIEIYDLLAGDIIILEERMNDQGDLEVVRVHLEFDLDTIIYLDDDSFDL